MKELEDERRLEERREICLKATFVEFAIMRSSTVVLKSVCEQMPILAFLESEQTPSALRQLASDAKSHAPRCSADFKPFFCIVLHKYTLV